MSFCDHCEGQRFDRARILRLLRESRRALKSSSDPGSAERALSAAIEAVRRLEVPHLELDEVADDEVIH